MPSYRALVRSRASLACILALASTLAASFSLAQEIRVPMAEGPSFVGYVPDELVVEFRRDVAHQLQALPEAAGRARANLPGVQALLDAVGARSFEKEFEGSRPQPLGGRFPDLTGFYVVKLRAGSNLDEALEVISRHPDVRVVQKNAIHTVDLRPNDVRYIWTPLPAPAGWPDRQWQYMGIYGIDNEPAWDVETGDPNVVVGILDTGVKYRHTDLGGNDPPGPADNVTEGNVWVNPGEVPANGIDDDANGKIDDVIGWDFIDDATNFAGASCEDNDCGIVDNDPNDGEGHGTHLAGTVAGITNNLRGIAGVVGGFSDGTTLGAGNGCKILPVRMGVRVRRQGFFTGVVTMKWAAQAMYYVAVLKEQGVNVAAINCSWGSSPDTALTNAVANLVAHDVVIANAAGNSNLGTAPYLATLPGVVAVGATDSTGVGASFSNHGTWVDVAAPGVNIISTFHDPTEPDTTLMYVGLADGTSMASPHVAGVAGLLESYNPTLTAPQKIDLLVNNTKPFAPANTKDLGSGILSASLSVAAAPAPVGVADRITSLGTTLRFRAHPNPLRQGAELLGSARPGAPVRVEILDASGRRMRTLVATADPSGLWRVRWNGVDEGGRAARAGLYLATATAGSARASHKLVVLE